MHVRNSSCVLCMSYTKKPKENYRKFELDSTTSTESSASSTKMKPVASSTSAKQTTKPEVPIVSNLPRGSIELVAEKKPFQNRFLPIHRLCLCAFIRLCLYGCEYLLHKKNIFFHYYSDLFCRSSSKNP